MCDKIIEIQGENTQLNPQNKWELIKFEARKLSINFSKKLAKEKREKKQKIENIVQAFETKPEIESGITENIYLASKIELETLHDQIKNKKGHILRAKCQWYEDGEKSTKYFLNLEKKKCIQSTVRTLIDKAGTTFTKREDILSKIQDFYKKLFSKSRIESILSCKNFLTNINVPKLSELEKRSCEVELSVDDLKEVLLSMEGGKSPGNDGLNKEWYVFFWDSISNSLFESIMEAKSKNSLSNSQRQAVFKLIEKKDKDK